MCSALIAFPSTKKLHMSLWHVLTLLSALPLGASLIRAGIRPDAVARLMSKIEDEWRYQADAFAHCEDEKGKRGGKCPDMQKTFGKSCSTVVGAVMRGSDGDHDRVQVYMTAVCNEHTLSNWHRARCYQFKRS